MLCYLAKNDLMKYFDMGRIPRWRMVDGVCHVYNCAINSAMILSTDDEKNLFADLVRKKLTTLSLNVYNYFHFAIEVLDIRILSAFISGLSSSYSKTFRARRNMGYGPLWQGRYKSILVPHPSRKNQKAYRGLRMVVVVCRRYTIGLFQLKWCTSRFNLSWEWRFTHIKSLFCGFL